MTEYPSAFPVNAEQWYIYPYPPGLDWVALPAAPDPFPFKAASDPRAKGFLNAEACSECHGEIVANFQKTAHAQTSGLPKDVPIPAAFSPPGNRLETRLEGFFFEMGQHDGQLFQDLVVEHDGQKFRHRTPVDLVIGTGSHGQSYVYRQGDRLYMHQAGYFGEAGWHGWANGPGFIDGTANLARPVLPQCLECHATYVAHRPLTANRYDLEQAIWGISCVRCHGPALEHVEYHRNHPTETEARHIVNPANLSRDRRIDVCAHCHSGREVAVPFQFQPGDVLDEFLKSAPEPGDQERKSGDPHTANQLARLAQSRCFTESSDLTCVSCHDPHTPKTIGGTTLSAQKCIQCHRVADCGVSDRTAESELLVRCVDCHMPVVPESGFSIEVKDGTRLTRDLRDHYIRLVQPADRGPGKDGGG